MGKSFLSNFIMMDIWAAFRVHLVIIIFFGAIVRQQSDLDIIFFTYSVPFLTIFSMYYLLPSKGKSYDVVSCVAQEPEASVFLPSSSDTKLGKCLLFLF